MLLALASQWPIAKWRRGEGFYGYDFVDPACCRCIVCRYFGTLGSAPPHASQVTQSPEWPATPCIGKVPPGEKYRRPEPSRAERSRPGRLIRRRERYCVLFRFPGRHRCPRRDLFRCTGRKRQSGVLAEREVMRRSTCRFPGGLWNHGHIAPTTRPGSVFSGWKLRPPICHMEASWN